jgi:hypothetical protein
MTGAVFTRTGRPFFPTEVTERLLARLRAALAAAGLWDEPAVGRWCSTPRSCRGARLAAVEPELIAPTRRTAVNAADPTSVAAGVGWWEELTGDGPGGEGMVVKPARGLARGGRGLVQPGINVRGRGYLRIVYGPDYTQPENLERLRSRGLGRKRSLAFREYALGLEAFAVVDLPSAAQAATVVHQGSMGDCLPAYQALARWIEDAGYRSVGPSREVTLACPADVDGWVTEIQEPIVRA